MESDAASWVSDVPNTVIALESVVSFGNDLSILLDANHIERQIAEAEPEAQTQAKRPTKRRASRTADIDALKRELIAHVKAARDHAVTSRDRTGEAKLLPRLRDICERLKRDSKSSVARELGMSQGAFYNLLEQIRQRFEQAGLREYL